MTTSDTKNLRGFAAAMIVVFCWAGFNILSRLGSKSALTPFDLAALRFGVAGVLMSPLFVGVWRRINAQQKIRFFIVSCVGSLGYALAAYTGFSLAPVAHGGVLINGGIPFVSALLAWGVLHQRLHLRQMLALLIALAGIVLIAVQNLSVSATPPDQWLGDLAFLFAACCWATSGLLMRRWHLQPVDTSAMMVGISAMIYLPVYLLFLPSNLANVNTATLLLQAIYQGVVVAIMSGFLYNYANHTIGPHKATLMLALVPGISAVLAVPLLGETLTPVTIGGVVLVTLGAVLGTTQKTRRV